MKMPRSIRLLAAAAVLCLGLAGCEPKAMTAFAAWEPEIVLYPGESWEGDIPADGKSPAYSITINTVPGLEARVEDGRLTLVAHQAGEGQLTLAAASKGYHDTTLTLPVRVETLPMEITWELVPGGSEDTEGDGEEEDGEEKEPVAWVSQERVGGKVGETFILALHTAKVDNASFALELSDDLGQVTVDGNLAAITVGDALGEGFLTITATAPNYGTNELSIPFSAVRGQLPLTITSQGEAVTGLELERDSSVTINASTGEGGSLSADLAPNADASAAAPAFSAKLSQKGGAFTIAANAVGEGTLTVTAQGEGWMERTVTVPVKIIKPTATVAPVDPQHSEVTVEPGGWIGIPLAIRPAGATVTASVETEGFTAEISGSSLTIAADEGTQGTAEVKLTVSADTYNTGSAAVTATAKLAPVQLTASAENLEMEEGESKAVVLTVTPEDAKVSFTTDDGVTAQYSDGKLTVTGKTTGTVKVTASAEGRDPAALTIKVVVTKAELPSVNTSAYAEDAAEIIRLTNEYRAANGVGTLEHVEIIDIPAAIRAGEAAERWSHTRPDGTEFNTVFAQCGLKYAAYGENLFAVNARFTPEQVLEEWKDSPSHNENLLRKEFDGIGVGICKVDGEYYYCQLFITE